MSGLDDLIDRIVAFQRPVDLRSRIKSLPATSRPRVYLSHQEECLSSDHVDLDIESLKIALRYLFLLYNPVEAISKCCDLSTLIALYKSCCSDDNFDHRTGEVEAVALRLLQIFEVPHLEEIGNVYSVANTLHRIEEIEHALQRGHEQYNVDLVWWQGSTINTWSLVEEVLKFSLGFFGLHFVELLPDAIFQPLRSGGPVSAIVKVVEEVEHYFNNGEIQTNIRKRNRERDIALKKVEGRSDLTDEERALAKRNLLQQQRDEQVEIDRQNKTTRKHLQSLCWSNFGRLSPYGSINAQEYKRIAGLDRNRFAHKPIEDLLDKSHNPRPVRESILHAKEIVQDLGQARVVPRVIIILGQGYDNFGNRMVWFSDRDIVPMRNEMEWLYLTSAVQYKPFQPLAMLAPNFDKGRPEPLIDPVMYPIETIKEFLTTQNREGDYGR